MDSKANCYTVIQRTPKSPKFSSTFQVCSSSSTYSLMETNRRKTIVVGGGLAGLCATIEAERSGSEVILIEKEPRIGGNSKKASSGINGVNTPAQKALHIEDSPQLFLQDTLNSGKQNNVDLVKVLVSKSTEAVEFLTSFGINLDEVTICGGHSVPRTHRSKPSASARNIGFNIMEALSNFLNSKPTPNLTILTSTRVTQLLTKDNAVVGVKVIDKDNKEDNIIGDAVILTSGGYAADRGGLLQQHVPSIAHLPTTNGPFAQGEGVKLATAIGAQVTDMDKVQVHPTGFVDPSDPLNPTKILAAEALRGCGGILVNSSGQRFVNELGLRNEITRSIFDNCQKLKISDGAEGPVVAYMLLNEESVKRFHEGAFGFYTGKGLAKVCDNYERAAEMIGADAAVLKETLMQYNESKNKGKDEFGKKTFPVTFSLDEKLYVLMVTPCIHYTMGGLKISTNAQVLGKDDIPIKGLYAAGEVTGGVHGVNRLAGNSLLECVVFGRIAGHLSALQSQ